MTLHWPWALTALLAFPLLLGYRWWIRRRRRRDAIRLSSVNVVRAALGNQTRWRRRIPLWLFAGGLVILATGAARPEASVIVPASDTAIILAMDVSGSMCSTDVSPNRLTTAQNAARDFIRAQPDGARIGLVTFAGFASLLVPPTTDKKTLLAAIDTLRTARGTAIGMAILTAIDAIAEINPDVPPTGVEVAGSGAGHFAPDTIVVLTDGRNNRGVDPVRAAQKAAARGLRVYTIGFGTNQPSPMVCTSSQVSGDVAFRGDGGGVDRGGGGGFGGGGRPGRVQVIDTETLTTIADTTRADYYKAEDADELNAVMRDLPSEFSLQHKRIEITAWFAFVGVALVIAAIALAQWWTRSTRSAQPSGSLSRSLAAWWPRIRSAVRLPARE